MTTDFAADEVRLWRLRNGLPPSDENTLLRHKVEAILARGIKTLDEARIVAQYRAMQEAEAGPKPQAKVVSPQGAAGNIARGAVETGQLGIELAAGRRGPVFKSGGKTPGELLSLPLEFIHEEVIQPSLGGIQQSFVNLQRLIRGQGMEPPKTVEELRELWKTTERPWGVTAVAENLPWLLVPSGTQAKVALGEEAALRTGLQRVLLEKGAGVLEPIVQAERIIGEEAGAVLKATTRFGAKALVKIPQRRVQETGLRLAGAPGGVAGGAPIPLRPSEMPSRITKFLKPDVQAKWDEVVKQADLLNIKTEALAGVLPDEYFLAAQGTAETPAKIRQAFFQSTTPPIPGMVPLPAQRTLFFADFSDLRQFLQTGEYKPPSLRFGGRPIENIKPEYVARQFAPEPKPLGARAERLRSIRRPQMGESLRPAQVSEGRRVAALEKLGQQQGIKVTIHPETPPAPTKPIAPVAPRAAPVAKEPWEMTHQEFYPQAASIGVGDMGPWERKYGLVSGAIRAENAPQMETRLHKAIVRQALLRGDDVPAHVLVDYPDLEAMKNVPTFNLERAATAWEAERTKAFEARQASPEIIAIQERQAAEQSEAARAYRARLAEIEARVTKPPAPVAPKRQPAPRGEMPGIRPTEAERLGLKRPFGPDWNSTANEWRFRLHPTSEIQPGGMGKDARGKPRDYISRPSTTPGVRYLIGKDKATGKEVTQTIRLNKAQFSESQASAWLEANMGRFKFWDQAVEEAAREIEVAGAGKAMVTPEVRPPAARMAIEFPSEAQARQFQSKYHGSTSVRIVRRGDAVFIDGDELSLSLAAKNAMQNFGGKPLSGARKEAWEAATEVREKARTGGVVRKEAVEDIAIAPPPAAQVAEEAETALRKRLRATNLRTRTEPSAVPSQKRMTEAEAQEARVIEKELGFTAPGRTPRARRTPPPGVGAPEAVPGEAAGISPPSPVAAPLEATGGGVGGPPGKPPMAQAGGIPPADPLESRPRTLADMNREAKGMRAMTPEQRAAVMDLAKPIEGDIIYQARPFNEHAQNLLGPDTDFMKALRSVPGLKQIYGGWNPAQMARDNPVAMIGLRQSIFQEIEKARIRFVTLRWWHEADTAFEFKQFETAYGLKPTTGVWRATKVKSAPGVVRGKMFGTFNDMIEHPERYVFTDDQSKVLYLADNTLTQSVRDAQRVGVNVVEMAEEYWPRIVTKGPKGEKGFAGVRKRVSAAKGYTHQRAFADIDDLVKAGYEVETDPRRVFASRLEAGVDTIAHANSRKQIASLPGVEKPLERMERRFPRVLQTAGEARVARDAARDAVMTKGPIRQMRKDVKPEQILTLRQAEADYIIAMRDVFAKKVEASEPGYYELRLPNGRIAPQKLVDQAGKFIDLPELRQAGEGAAARLTQEVSQLLRSTLTNVDVAAGFIQGQSLFYRNNVVWWKAQAQAILALIDDPTAFVAKNFDLMDEGVRAAAIVAPTEFLFAKQGIASIPLRIPYIGPGLGAFNRAFEWFITAGQTYLYKAARSGVAKNAGMDELVSLGSAIRKEVGTESYAILGVRPNQRTFEALSLFAARFFRANVGIIGQAFTPGAGGREARIAMGSLIAGGTALTMGIKWAQDKELPNMTDPYAPDWMQWRWGRTYFSAFGPFYPYFRTMARMSVAFAEGDPWKARRALTSFLQSKESLPLRAIDIAGQLIYFGSANVYGTKIERTWTSIARGILSEFVTPISAQEIPAGLAGGRPETVLEFGGLVGRPVRLASEWAKDLQPYWDIPTKELERIAYWQKLGKADMTREKYRADNPEVDAKLFITGAVSSLVTPRSPTGWTSYASVDAALALIQEHDINPDDIKAIKARKKLLADYAKERRKPPESKGIDRLIALLKSSPPSSKAPTPAPVPASTQGLAPEGLSEAEKRWWIENNLPTPVPVGAR